MSKVKIARPSAGLIVAVIALVVALGGSAVAVTALNKREKQQVKKIAKRLDKGVSDSASRKIKGLRQQITSPRSADIPLPGLGEPECGSTEGWYGYTWGETGEIIQTFADIGGPVWFSGGALYCGGSNVAFTVPKPFRPTGYARRLPVIVADGPPEDAAATAKPQAARIGLGGRVSVPGVNVGQFVDFSSISFFAGGPNQRR